MRRLSLGKRIILGFSLALLLLLFLSVVAYRNILVLMETSRSVAHTGEVLATLESLLAQAQDAEVERGYLLTGDELFLAPYHTARQTILSTLQHLRQLTTDNPHYQEQLATLESLIKQRLTLAKSIIDLRQAKGPKVAISMMQSGRGRALMAEIHLLVDDLRSEEVTLLQQQRIAVDRSAQTVLRVILMSNVLAFVFVAFAGGTVSQALTRRKAAERTLLQAYTTMEQRGVARPAALSQPNRELPHESTERQQAEAALHGQPTMHSNSQE